ncbi:ABC transporter substrate-binding protein [Acutalibacter intestini]|uniref:ABC transporter substrate-binding protein n=1 Tax=Acutalibacter intestini TaxID=3093659 RepID=UPI002AC97E82|nr:ABC transporter substrate-binding protein [Acutalibacter sp. M00204]
MKKFLCLLLVLGLAIGGLAGCSKKEEENQGPSSVENSSSPVEQEKRVLQIGLVQYMEYAPLDQAREAFISRLDEWGYDDGKLAVDYQNAGGDRGKVTEICEKFIKNKVDVIVAISPPAAKGAVEAAKKDGTKVVFLGVGDPKTELGIANPEQPEGSVTGVADAAQARAAVDFALQVNPELKTMGLLFDPSGALGTITVEELRKVCGEKSITVVEGQVSGIGEVKQRMTELCSQADAVFSPMDNTVAAVAQEAAQVARDAGKPWYVSSEDLVQQGALAGVSVDYTEAGNQAADMAVQMIAGRAVEQLPVWTPTGRISVNQETMSILAAQVPEEVLEQASYY